MKRFFRPRSQFNTLLGKTNRRGVLLLVSILFLSCSKGSDDSSPVNQPTDSPSSTKTIDLNETEDNTPMHFPRVRIILLKTSDVEITDDKIKRLRDIGTYSEQFYTNQLNTKGYALANTKMFARNTDGNVLIYSVESPLSANQLPDITTTAINLCKEKFSDLNDLNSIWAVPHFQENGGSSGKGSVKKGRMKFSYKTATGSIDFSKHPSGTQFHKDIILKAILHELGHALTLPHNGPLLNDTTHNTLMGPVNSSYEKILDIETADVRISGFSAALIANHPVFKNQPFDETTLTGKTIRIEKLPGDTSLFTADCDTSKEQRVRGKVVSNLPFHHVVIRFLYDGNQNLEYWAKAFAVKPDRNGMFELIVNKDDINIHRSDQYELMVCFNNGLTQGVSRLETDIPIQNLNKNEYVEQHAFCE
ncbi:MAG: hypothetical protein ISP68_04095 [Flavobacteriaceae bacterium]|nr:hypothetical protein [Flavobacteriaceae bacterium]